MDIIDIVKIIVRGLPQSLRCNVNFCDERPSLRWLNGVLKRNKYLKIRSMGVVDKEPVGAQLVENVGKHVNRVQSTMDKYKIKDDSFIFNLDGKGVSFMSMDSPSIRKGIAEKGKTLYNTIPRTEGNLERMKLMAVVNADGQTYKPLTVMRGKKPHYRRLGNGSIETVQKYLPDCYLLHRDLAGIDYTIFGTCSSYLTMEQPTSGGMERSFSFYTMIVTYRCLCWKALKRLA